MNEEQFTPTEEEMDFLEAYRRMPCELQNFLKAMLNVDNPENEKE